MIRKIVLGLEILVGAILIVCGICEGRETAIEVALGGDVRVYHGLMILGGFYIIKSLVQLMLEAFDPTADMG